MSGTPVDLKLEVVVLPVSDVDRSKRFYEGLGWRVDADFSGPNNWRAVQLTPPGSPCSVHFGRGITTVAPGSVKNTYLVVSDIDEARRDLTGRGAEVSETFHFDGFGGAVVPGRAPGGQTYGTYATFSDPDGNSWLLQEVTTRLPGRVDASATTFGSVSDLKAALMRAAAAHGEHEKRTGQEDPDWPDWYAEYMVREQSGEPLPS